MSTTSRDQHRWAARPVAGIAIRLLSYALPIAASLLTAWVLATLTPPLPGTGWRIAAVVGVLLASTAALVVTEVLARRLLPLSALLRMTLAFPDTAPSRYRIARMAGRVRDIEARVERARELGLSDEPVEAAVELLTLVAALSCHDRGTRGHAERTRVFVDMLAEELDLPPDDRDRLRWAALLHDIGKLHVPVHVLNKPGKPDDDEWEQLRQHPERGMALASALHDFLGPWADTIHHHHERWDGTGYPQRLAGTEISRGGRIVAVADSFEVMTAARPYKQPMTAVAAREELTRCAGEQFDPAVVRAFLQISIGRLRWTIGPVAWLAQSPLLLGLGSRALEVGSALTRGAAALAVGGATIVAGPALAGTVDDHGSTGRADLTAEPSSPPLADGPRVGADASTDPSDDRREQDDHRAGDDPDDEVDTSGGSEVDDADDPVPDDGGDDEDGEETPPPPPPDDDPGGGVDEVVDEVVGGVGDGVDEVVEDARDLAEDPVGGVEREVDEVVDVVEDVTRSAVTDGPAGTVAGGAVDAGRRATDPAADEVGTVTEAADALGADPTGPVGGAIGGASGAAAGQLGTG